MDAFCERVEQEGLLIRLLDKELTAEEEDALLAHLHDCKKCLALLADLMLTDAQLRQTMHVGKLIRNVVKEESDSTDPAIPTQEPKPERVEILELESTGALATGDRIKVKDLPVGSTLNYNLHDLRGQLLIARGIPITEQIVGSLLRRQITVVSLGPPQEPSRSGLAHEALSLRGRPNRKFYVALEKSNITVNISTVARQVALDSLKKAFYELGPDVAIDLDDVKDTCDEMVDDLVGDDVTTLSIIDMYLLDNSLYHHSINVTAIFATICRGLNLPAGRVKAYSAAAMLHDLGRILLRKIAFRKATGRVDIDRLHTEAGYKYLTGLRGMEEGPLNAVRNHHERYDGNGYPRGIDFKELGDYGQALILANCYDKITWDSSREMKARFHQAANFIIQLSCKLVDTHIITAFLNVFGHHPPGSWVQLSSGEAGLVVQASPFKPRRPKVHIFYDQKGEPLAEVIPLDLSTAGMPVVVGPYRPLNGDAIHPEAPTEVPMQ